MNKNYPAIIEIQEKIRALYRKQTERYKQECIESGFEWNDETKRNDPWKGIKQYKFAEYRLKNGPWVEDKQASQHQAQIWVFRESDPSWPNANTLSAAHKTEEDPECRYYTPLHPQTGQPCPAPARGWLWRENNNLEKPDVLSFEKLVARHLIAFGKDENKIPQYKRFLHTVGTDVVKSVITDFTDGEKELAHIVGKRGTFSNPKPTSIGRKLIEITTDYGDIVLDYFAGSGTAVHAVLQQNLVDEKQRRFIAIEMGSYFDKTFLPRIKKNLYSVDWKDGQPVSPNNSSKIVKILRVESYEDTLNNLELEDRQPDLLGLSQNVRDDYLLHYMLDVETRGSILNLPRFKDPFNCTLKIYNRETGEAEPQPIDLPETFNYLLGLKVRECQMRGDILTIEGENPVGETVLIIWRNVKEKDNAALESFVTKTLRINTADTEYKAIYINGDTTLDDPHKKIMLTEDVFHNLMFDVQSL